MTFQQSETGLVTGQPIELYRFLGTYGNYYFTSHPYDVMSAGELYKAIPISRNKLEIGTQEESELTLEINMPFDEDMIRDYAFRNSPPRLRFQLLKVHQQDLFDRIIMWTGLVQAFAVEGRIAKLRVPSVFSYVLTGNVPRIRYQAPCNHVLYDERCGVNEAFNAHVTPVLSISGNTVVIASSPFAEGDCNGGVMNNQIGEARMIKGQSGGAFTLSYPFSNLTVGMNVRINRGCDHSLTTCRDKFNNHVRFGGFPLVPAVNPFTKNFGSGG